MQHLYLYGGRGAGGGNHGTLDFPTTERTPQFYGHGDPAHEAVAEKHLFSSFYEPLYSSTRGAQVGKGEGEKIRWCCRACVAHVVTHWFRRSSLDF